MHPNNAMRHDSIQNVWLAEYDGSEGPKSAKAFHKKECRRAVRRDAKRDIKDQLDNGGEPIE